MINRLSPTWASSSCLIRAQATAFEDFIAFKGEQGAKDASKMRAGGKEYVVKDGDVMNFWFGFFVSIRLGESSG